MCTTTVPLRTTTGACEGMMTRGRRTVAAPPKWLRKLPNTHTHTHETNAVLRTPLDLFWTLLMGAHPRSHLCPEVRGPRNSKDERGPRALACAHLRALLLKQWLPVTRAASGPLAAHPRHSRIRLCQSPHCAATACAEGWAPRGDAHGRTGWRRSSGGRQRGEGQRRAVACPEKRARGHNAPQDRAMNALTRIDGGRNTFLA